MKTKTQSPEVIEGEVFIDQIKPDPNQPRKTFDPNELSELAESIKISGVIQPIIIRQIMDVPETCYMIVCGERRYQASKLAGKETIPAVIRDLNNTQVLEYQIIENLQRENIPALEEARAILNLRKDYKVTEIAALLGKSEKFVSSRLKLNDLIESFREMLLLEKITTLQALSIARLNIGAQEQIFEYISTNYNTRDWRTDEDFQLNNLDRLIDNTLIDLSKALFDLSDITLNPGYSSCTVCPHNTANDLLLFEDKKGSFCRFAPCYLTKEENNFNRLVEAAPKEDMVFIRMGYDKPEEDELKTIEMINELGFEVVETKDFRVIHKPDPIYSWEECLQENDDWTEDPDMDEAEKAEKHNDLIKEYEEAVLDNQGEIAEYELKSASGLFKKGLVIHRHYSSYKKGEVMLIELKDQDVVTEAGSEQIVPSAKKEIERINEREKRNQELDNEKIYSAFVNDFSGQFTKRDKKLSNLELKAAIYMLTLADSKASDVLSEISGDDRYSLYDQKLMDAIDKHTSMETLNRMLRAAIVGKMVNSVQLDFGKLLQPKMITLLAEDITPALVQVARDNQKIKSDKRQVNVKSKLAVLKTQLKAK